MTSIAILASGNGSNAEAIARYLAQSPLAQVACILTNRPDAGVRARAERLGIPHYYYSNAEMREASAPLELLGSLGVDLIVLAGYMNLISQPWLEAYPARILNIHPALLPGYGGKGMYGHHVHEAVLANREATSGITIHLVDEHYDHGRYLVQASCPVLPTDTPDTLAGRIHQLEHHHYPRAIAYYIEHELPLLCL